MNVYRLLYTDNLHSCENTETTQYQWTLACRAMFDVGLITPITSPQWLGWEPIPFIILNMTKPQKYLWILTRKRNTRVVLYRIILLVFLYGTENRSILWTLGSCFLYPYGPYDNFMSSESFSTHSRENEHKTIVTVIIYVIYVRILYEIALPKISQNFAIIYPLRDMYRNSV